MSPKSVTKVDGYYQPLGPYSHVVGANCFLFLSAQVSLRPDGSSKEFVGKDVKEQTRQVLGNIKLLLEKSGSSMEDVVKVTVFLANPKDSAGMNEVYREFFPREPPARAVAKLGLESPDILIAIDVIATRKK